MARNLRLARTGTPIGRRLDLALDLCDTADALSSAGFRRDHHVETKPDRSFVTEADRAIETLVRNQILEAFPGDGIVGEEFGERRGTSGFRWFIDPIDGTHNYMRGIPVFATLLAAEMDGQLELGVVSAPELRRRWFAWRGGGAWVVGRSESGWDMDGAQRLQVSRIGRIEEAQVVYSSPYDVEASGHLPGFRDTLSRAWRDRGFGDFWGYTMVAEGCAEAMIEVGMHSWDLAPVRLLVEEAGGTLTDFDGVATIHGAGAIASNGILHDRLLDAFHGPTERPPTS